MASAVLTQLKTFGPENCRKLSYEEASRYTLDLARSQYENFTVVSWFLPRRLRDDFHHVYAFCRWADDLGDEVGDAGRSLELLAWWRRELDACYAGRPRHPVFVALEQTIARHDIPRQPFDDLIDAFVQDQNVKRYRQWEQVLDYCARSANPVGRLVLYLGGHRDAQRQALADATCTALQLANFWQDVRRDIIERDRIYIPSQIASRHQLDLDTLVQVVKHDEQRRCESSNCCSSCANMPGLGMTAMLGPYQDTLHELVQRTWPLFVEGRKLWPLLEADVRLDIKLFTLGGEAVLKMIRRRNYDTLRRRPSLSKARKLSLLMYALSGKAWASLGLASPVRGKNLSEGGRP